MSFIGVAFVRSSYGPGAEGVKEVPTIRRARKVLGWEPRVEFEEGIVQTIEYFRGCLERGELGERLQL